MSGDLGCWRWWWSWSAVQAGLGSVVVCKECRCRSVAARGGQSEGVKRRGRDGRGGGCGETARARPLEAQ